ncbi:MAG TPA: H-NS histone family protein [Candidatus Competibacteraceae bacterium]|nr:H-NS histone family protein [Candidatus Competibacteraceae bacterium]
MMVANIDLNVYSIPELKELIAKAEKEIQRKEQLQVKEIRSKIEELASSVGMTPEQVLSFDIRKRKAGGAGAGTAVRYRNPDNPSQTWSGRGKQPNWLKEALERGAKKEDFAV